MANSGDIIYINDEYRAFLDTFTKKDVLGFKLLDNKYSFLLAVALGVNSPIDRKRKRHGWTRKSYIKAVDKAFFSAVLLGTATTDDQINAYTNIDKCVELCEQCAESGFEQLKKQYDSVEGDTQLLERRMLKQLDLLFTQNVENDI